MGSGSLTAAPRVQGLEIEMTTRKEIRRATEGSAHAAMARHIEKMLSNGWKLGQQFSGNAGFGWKSIAHFYK